MLLFAVGVNAQTIAVVVFILAMVLWLIGGVEWSGGYRGIGVGLLPWLAVATLAYLTLG